MIHRLLLVISATILLSSNITFASDKPDIFVQLGHSSTIKSATFTSDGTYLISGSEDRTVKIWETATGKEIKTLRHEWGVTAIAISPDNKTILAGDENGNIAIWETVTWKLLGKMVRKNLGKIYSLFFSPDGRHVVATDFFRLVYFDVLAKKQVFTLNDGQNIYSKGGKAINYNVAVFTKDGRRLILGEKQIEGYSKGKGISISIYDIKSRKNIKRYELFTGEAQIHSLAVSPDERHLLVSSSIAQSKDIFEKSGKVFVVDIQNGNIIREISFPEPFFGAAYSPAGNYVAIANYGEIIIYETKNWNVLRKISARLPVAFSPDGQSLIYGNDNAWTYYGQWVHKTGLDLINIKTGNRLNRYAANVDQMTSASFAAGEREIVSKSWILLNWDRENGTMKKALVLKDAANRMLTASAASEDGKYLIVGNDYGSYIYHTADGRMRRMWDKPIPHPDFTADGKILFFSTYDRKVILWDIENNRQIRQFADWGRREKLFIDYNKISPDGRYAVVLLRVYEQEGEKRIIIVWDTNTGREINKSEVVSSIYSLIFSPDSRYILTGEVVFAASASETEYSAVLRSLPDNRIVRKFPGHNDVISALAFSRNGEFILTGSWDQRIILWETKNGKKVKTFVGCAGTIYTLEFSADNINFVSASHDNAVRLWNINTGKELAQFISFTDGEWIVITPEGYFNASPNGAKHLNVRVGNSVYSIDNFYEKFFNPVYVASVLQGKEVEAVADITKGILTPPDVKITSPEPNTSFSTDTATITISAKDTGGGIDEIRLYHNGKAIGEDQRAVKIVPKGNEVIKTYTVTLVDGINTFRATAFSKDRTESNPYELVVKLSAPSKDVSMHVFAVGINKYKNPALNLNYAEPDAKGIADFFKQKGKGLFKDIEVKEIYNEQATKESISAKLKQLQNTNPQDVVLIYLAGHGENINDKWYFIPHELTYPEREEHVKTKGISSDELSGLIKNIKAQKILLLIDACKSGAVLIAFRGFEDRKALSQLSRSTGVHIVAASTKDQFASEVKELGHGVFTYIMLEGLKGKAVGKGETVTVRKLMGYIEEKLPEITKKYKQEAQFPVVDSRGMDFPLVLTK
ncbi:MAG: caspase family protein [Thermodesulfovibrionales bacterium]|jgi:WD40 repeat protein|nr:caspase family protein [Thermodesulfovibrionales bacterium]